MDVNAVIEKDNEIEELKDEKATIRQICRPHARKRKYIKQDRKRKEFVDGIAVMSCVFSRLKVSFLIILFIIN